MKENRRNLRCVIFFLSIFFALFTYSNVVFSAGNIKFDEALKKAAAYPEDPLVQVSLARAYNEKGEYGKALFVAHRVLELLPGCPPALLELAHAYRMTGDHKSAVEFYRSYLGTNPTSIDALTGNSESLACLALWEESFGAATAAIRSAPKNAAGYGALGRAYRIAGRFDEAIDLLNQGLSFDGKNAEILFDLGMCHAEKGDRASALVQYEKLIDLDGEASRRLFDAIYP